MTLNEVYEYVLNDARKRGANIEDIERELQCLSELYDDTWEFDVVFHSKKKALSPATPSSVTVSREPVAEPRRVMLEVEHDPELGPRYELECNGLGGHESFSSYGEEMINEFLAANNLVIDRIRTTSREDNK